MLLKSRKFWIMVVDVAVSLATYFIGRYINPESAKDILFVIGSLQPVILSVIVAITVQNVEGIRADSAKDEAIIYNAANTPVDPE